MSTNIKHITLSLLALGLLGSCRENKDYQQQTQLLKDVRVDFARSWPKQDKVSKLSQNPLYRNLVLVFDGSGSMADKNCLSNERKIDVAKRAVKDFIQNMPEDVRFGMIKFDASGTREVVSLGQNNSAEALGATNAIQAGGDTPLKRAIEQGYTLLESAGSEQLGYGDYYLVIVTDGEPSPDQDPTPAILKIVKDSPVQIFTIGFCIGKQHILNQPQIITYSTAETASQLSAELQLVLAESEDFSVTSFQE